jgi:hypothetical protein
LQKNQAPTATDFINSAKPNLRTKSQILGGFESQKATPDVETPFNTIVIK